MADGHISEKDVICNSVDKDHLIKLANLLNVKINSKKYTNSYNQKVSEIHNLSASNKDLILKWRDMLRMEHTAKTYFPPNLNIFNNLFIYFFIGFVDGDGCI